MGLLLFYLPILEKTGCVQLVYGVKSQDGHYLWEK